MKPLELARAPFASQGLRAPQRTRGRCRGFGGLIGGFGRGGLPVKHIFHIRHVGHVPLIERLVEGVCAVHLPQCRCRVRCSTGSKTRAFLFHCTRQSDPPPPTIEFDTRFDKSRAIDGNEACWFVWKIEPDEGGRAAVVEPAPARLVPA